MEEYCICGKCQFHKYCLSEQAWVCTCKESENYSDWTEYSDSCPDGEER